MKIVNIITTYNRSNHLDFTLTALKNEKFKNIILVDNASTDDTKSILLKYKNQFDLFHILTKQYNSGSSGGIYSALKLALAACEDTDYFLIHDDDSWPKFSYESLLNFLTRSSISLGCFPVVYPNGMLSAMNRPGNLKIISKPFERASYLNPRRPSQLNDFPLWNKFDYCSFVGLVISFKIVKTVGLPNPRFFIYSDDTFYTSWLTQKRGYVIKNISFEKSVFVHDCNRSSGKTLLNSKFAYFEVKNKIIFIKTFSSIPIIHSLQILISSIFVAPRKIKTIVNAFFAGYFEDIKKYYPLSVS